MLLPDPKPFSVIEWTDYVNLDVGAYGIAPRLDRENDWQSWAAIVVSFPAIAAKSPPNPYSFTDWREWATRFNQSTNSLS